MSEPFAYLDLRVIPDLEVEFTGVPKGERPLTLMIRAMNVADELFANRAGIGVDRTEGAAISRFGAAVALFINQIRGEVNQRDFIRCLGHDIDHGETIQDAAIRIGGLISTKEIERLHAIDVKTLSEVIAERRYSSYNKATLLGGTPVKKLSLKNVRRYSLPITCSLLLLLLGFLIGKSWNTMQQFLSSF